MITILDIAPIKRTPAEVAEARAVLSKLVEIGAFRDTTSKAMVMAMNVALMWVQGVEIEGHLNTLQRILNGEAVY